MEKKHVSDWTRRQIDIVDKWHDVYNCVGLLEAYTAFGKTYGISVRAIKKVNPKKLIITVPRIVLKEDWEKILKENGIEGEVIVVNTLIKQSWKCDMLIIDEVHRFAAETFINTFNLVEYKQLLCLTASLKRSDDRQNLILEKAPLIDTVTIEEGLKKGWVAPFEVIKVPIELTVEEQEKLAEINEMYEDAKDMLGKGNPINKANIYRRYINLDAWLISKKTKKLWFKKDVEKKIGNKLTPEIIEKFFEVPTTKHIVFKKALAAKRYDIALEGRKKLLYNAKNKFPKTLELIEKYEGIPKFVFSQRINFILELSKMMGDKKFVSYHSKMSAKKKRESLASFEADDNEIDTMLAVKALIEGVNIPKLTIMILSSYDSTDINRIQSWGRAIRKFKDKKATIIYLYVPETQEENWLNILLKVK